MSSIVDLKKDIMNNELKRFYLFVGDEIGLMNVYINQIKQPVARETSIAPIWKKLVQRGIVPDEKVYVVRDDKEFISNEAKWKKFPEIRYGTLIILITKIDKRSKLLKAYPEHTIEFERMTPMQLQKHFIGKYSLDVKIVKQVIALCENDYSRIENELDKISRVKGADKRTVEQLVFTGIDFDVFKTVDLIMKKQYAPALSNVDDMFAKGEGALGLLTILYNNFVAAAKVLGTQDPKESTIHVKQFIINKIKYDFKYSIDSAFTGMDILGDTIEGIKQGKFNEKQGTYLALYKIFNMV